MNRVSMIDKKPLTLDELNRAIFLWHVLVDNDYQYTLMELVEHPHDGSEWEHSDLWAYLWNIFKSDGETLSQIIDAYFDEDATAIEATLDDDIVSEMVTEFDRRQQEQHAMQMLIDDAMSGEPLDCEDEYDDGGVSDEA